MPERILVVDDEPDILKAVVFRLEKSGYEVISAGDGEKALEMVEEYLPNLILLDLRLPLKDGFEVCGELKSNDKFNHIPVILLTASSGTKSEKLKNCKYDSFVLKPFQYDDLLGKIRELLPG